MTDVTEASKRPPDAESEGPDRSSCPKASSSAPTPTHSLSISNMAVATAPATNSRHWKNTTLSWAEVCNAVVTPGSRKECGNWLFGLLRETTEEHNGRSCTAIHRNTSAVEFRSAITLDADHTKTPLSEMLAQIELVFGYACAAHTTWSHTHDAPRYRLIVPTNRAMAPEEYNLAARVLMEQLGSEHFDPASAKPAQYMYRPSTQHPDAYEYAVVHGAPVDVDELLRAAAAAGLALDASLVPSPESGADASDVSTPLTPEGRKRAAEYVREQADKWRARFAEAVEWSDGERDDEGRGWEALARDWAWACARMAGTPWTGLDADSARVLYDEVLPAVLAANEQCRNKWDSALLSKAASEPTEPAPWDTPFDAVPDDPTGARREYAPPDQPVVVAREILRDLWPIPDHPETYTLAGWRGGWMEWRTTHWAEIADEDLYSFVTKHLEHAYYWTRKGTVPWNPTKQSVSNLLSSMGALSRIPSETDAPSWLRPRPGVGVLVSCQNGLLDVDTRQLAAHDPAFFNTVSVPFDYDPDAATPVRWHAFLESVWPDDADAHALLQQWFGYVLSGRTDLQKMFALTGPRRSGKGTIARVLTSVVGAGNVAGPSLHSLGTNFGLGPLLGKSLAIVGDARLGTGDGAKAALATILGISGEDTMQVDRKYRDPWNGRLPVRIMLMSNELPSFYDASGAIASRFLLLPMTKSFYGQEDPQLGAELLKELPGILNWGLDGLADLNRRGTFTEPASAADMRREFDELVSPITLFVEEHCELGPDFWAPTQELYEAWARWCFDTGHTQGSRQLFAKNLRAALPELEAARRGTRGDQVYGYNGIRLRQSVLKYDTTTETFYVDKEK